jgi:hypothetical protein
MPAPRGAAEHRHGKISGPYHHKSKRHVERRCNASATGSASANGSRNAITAHGQIVAHTVTSAAAGSSQELAADFVVAGNLSALC